VDHSSHCVLSFVVPAFNEESYLDDCLEAILKQTAKLLVGQTEIVVVNNASTDRTREIALRYPGVIVVDEPRKGLTFARQAGFLNTSGTLIANVDADSRLTPGWVDQVLAAFAADSNLVALSGPFTYYELTPMQQIGVRGFYLIAWLTYVINRYILRVGSMVQGGNFIVSRAALERIGGFNLAISFYGEDTDIARRMSAVGDVLFTHDLKMFSSARRLKKEGLCVMAARYTINYLWTTFLKRPFSSDHIDIREQTEPQTEL
jgi:glycosyltransferase involved in cell wall biosynthesis